MLHSVLEPYQQQQLRPALLWCLSWMCLVVLSDLQHRPADHPGGRFLELSFKLSCPQLLACHCSVQQSTKRQLHAMDAGATSDIY